MLYLLIAALYGIIGLSAPLLIVWWFARKQRSGKEAFRPRRAAETNPSRAFVAKA
jgi:hypothetical protein